MSEIKFSTRPGEPQDGEAQYIADDGSFDFEKSTSSRSNDGLWLEGGTSLLVGTLQIEVDVEHRIALHVWGYHPRESWTSGEAVPPEPHDGLVVVSSPNHLIPGVSLGVAEIGAWPTTYDKNSGWVSVRSNPHSKDDQTVLIATNTLLGLIGDSLNSIWIKPVFL